MSKKTESVKLLEERIIRLEHDLSGAEMQRDKQATTAHNLRKELSALQSYKKTTPDFPWVHADPIREIYCMEETSERQKLAMIDAYIDASEAEVTEEGDDE